MVRHNFHHRAGWHTCRSGPHFNAQKRAEPHRPFISHCPSRTTRAGLPVTITVCLLGGGGNNFTCPLPADLPPACAATFCSCEPGQYYDRGACADCEPGFYSTRGAAYCSPCPSGAVSGAAAGACTVCPAGTFANVVTQQCQPVGQGAYTPIEGMSSALICPAGTFAAANGSSCTQCPYGSTSPPSSSALSDCACPFGLFADYSADMVTFDCRPCPTGAVCDSTRFPHPLAQAGYWHSLDNPTRFYVCPEGVCLAEDPSRNIFVNKSNCREGAQRRQAASLPPGPPARCSAALSDQQPASLQ